MIVRELLTKLGFQTDQATLNKYERSVGNIKSRADEAANSFRNMFAAFIGFQGLKSLANTADEMQSLEARIGKLPQTVGSAADAFDAVADRASAAKQGIDAYTTFYIKAGNATQDFISSQYEVLNIVDGVAMGLAASGAGTAAQSQAFFQLGQAIGSPTVQMEEMNTLIDVAPDLFRALGKAIPGANGNLKKFISTGQVTGKMLAEGLVAVMPEFEKQMRSMPMTIGTAGVLINNKWSKIINKLNRESGTVTSVANFLIDGFDMVESAIKDLIKLLGGASNTIRLFGIIAAVALAPFIGSLLLGAAMALPMIAAVIAIGLAIDDVITFLRGGESVIGKFFNAFKVGMDTKGSPALVLLAALLSYVTLLLSMAAIGAIVNYAKMTAAALFHYKSTRIAALYSYAMQGAAFTNMVVKMLWGYGVIAAKAMWAGVRIAAAWLIGLGPIGLIIAAVTVLGALIYKYWDKLKSIFGFKGVSMPASKVAGAAASPSGVAGAGSTSNASVTINQELPPGTTKETADAAKSATKMAMAGSGLDFLTGGMGAYSQ